MKTITRGIIQSLNHELQALQPDDTEKHFVVRLGSFYHLQAHIDLEGPSAFSRVVCSLTGDCSVERLSSCSSDYEVPEPLLERIRVIWARILSDHGKEPKEGLKRTTDERLDALEAQQEKDRASLRTVEKWAHENVMEVWDRVSALGDKIK